MTRTPAVVAQRKVRSAGRGVGHGVGRGAGRGAIQATLGILLVCLGGLVALGCGREASSVEEPVANPAESHSTQTATLYFPGSRGKLYGEARDLPASQTTEERVTALVAALLAGPRGEGLVAPLPAEVTLASVYRAPNGTAFLNFESPDNGAPPSVGSTAELQIVYSLVDTVLLNAPSIDRVALLWNGSQPATFAGHVDTSHPLVANRALIAEKN